MDTWSIRKLIKKVRSCAYSIILHWRMKSLKPFQTHTASVVALSARLKKPFQVSPSYAMNDFWIWSSVSPKRRAVPICGCHAAWGATVFQLPGVISHDSLQWKRNVETRTHSAPKNHSLPAIGNPHGYMYDWWEMWKRHLIRRKSRHSCERRKKTTKLGVSKCLTWHWTRR